MAVEWGKLRSLGEALFAARGLRALRALPAWQRLVLFPIRITTAVVQDFLQGQITLRAMSLVYTTLLSLVPLIAISFSVLKGFGVHNQVAPFLDKLLEPLGEKGAEISARIVDFVNNVQVGLLGFIGFLLLFYTVVSLLQKVERAFNYIWHVPVERGLTQKFRDYLSAVILGPVLVIGAMGAIATLMASDLVQRLIAIGPMGVLIAVGGRLVSFAFVVGAFAFVFSFLPNTKVRLGAALWGGLVAGTLWAVVGWGFASFIVRSAQYTVIYSAFATLLLFMIWLYLVWLIVLVGSAVAFYVQNPHYIGIRRDSVRYGVAYSESVALLAMRSIVRVWYERAQPWTAERLAREVNAPMPVMVQVLGALERAGLLKRAGERDEVFLPAAPPEQTPVKAVLDALRHDRGTGHPATEPLALPGPVAAVVTGAEEAVEGALGRITLKDLAAPDNSGR